MGCSSTDSADLMQYWANRADTLLESRDGAKHWRVSPNTSHFAIHHRKPGKSGYNSTGTSFYQWSPALQSPQELQLHDANFLLWFPFSQEERENQQVRSIPFPKIILAALLQGHTLCNSHCSWFQGSPQKFQKSRNLNSCTWLCPQKQPYLQR